MHDFVGKWYINSMSNWSQKFVNLIEPGYFRFTEDGLGEFVFCAMKGFMDVRVSTRTPFLEYTWQGVSEGDDYSGRGWFEFETPFVGYGRIFIHCGDESEVAIKLANET